MSWRESINSLTGSKSHSRVVRKLQVENTNPNERAIYFEVGKPISKHRPELGDISAIIFDEKKSIEYKQPIHVVYIVRDGEEYAWKEVWDKRVVEFDVDN